MSQQLTTQEILAEVDKPKRNRLFDLAVKLGVVHKGWTGVDYLRYAIENFGWECHIIWGVKGSAKSNLLLQRGYAIYKNWDAVFNHLIFELEDFGRILNDSGRIPWVGADDIAVHLPKNLYFTDRTLWAELQENWEALRTKINCFDCTATRKNKVVGFISDDITGDILCYNRSGEVKSHYDYQRWMWTRDYKDPQENYPQSVKIEDIPFPLLPESLNIDTQLREGKYIVGGVEYDGKTFFSEHAYLLGVERQEFRKYWERRLLLAEKAKDRFCELLSNRAAQKLQVTMDSSGVSQEKSAAGKALRSFGRQKPPR